MHNESNDARGVPVSGEVAYNEVGRSVDGTGSSGVDGASNAAGVGGAAGGTVGADKAQGLASSLGMRLAAPITLAALITIWQLVCMAGLVPGYMLPSPLAVVQALVSDWPLLCEHAVTSLIEAGLGLAAGVALGFISALLMDRFEVLYRAVYPLVVLTQTIPSVAIAPLLVLWFGYDMLPKVVLIVVTTFFPITVGLLEGLRSVDPDEIDLLRSMGATRGQIMRHVKLPAALPQFFSGLKISAAYAIVGAVIAEWLGGFSGLGVYMTRVRKAYSFDKMFAVIFLISALSLLLMWAVEAVRRISMPWERGERKS